MSLVGALTALGVVFAVGLLLVAVIGVFTWGLVAAIRKTLGRNH